MSRSLLLLREQTEQRLLAELCVFHGTFSIRAAEAENGFIRVEGTPTDCVGCHLPDFQQTVNPNHSAAGFPTNCQICHDPSDS